MRHDRSRSKMKKLLRLAGNRATRLFRFKMSSPYNGNKGRRRGPTQKPSLEGMFDESNDDAGDRWSKNPSRPLVGASERHKRIVTMPFPTYQNGIYDFQARCPAEVKAKFDQLNSFSGKEHTAQLERIVKEHTPEYEKFNFNVLRNALGHLPDASRSQYFDKIFPGIVSLAKDLPGKLSHRPLVFLTPGVTLELRRDEIACLLANAYLCTFPYRDLFTSTLPTVNFITLFSGQPGKDKRESAKVEKLKCLFAYFSKAMEFGPEGEEKVSFSKVALNEKPDWENSQKPMKTFNIEELEGKIEDFEGIQVDFANKLIGGGVIGRGCQQEEIRFITCPELIAARLFTEQLEDNEALVITNFWQYSDHSGYQDDFKYEGPFTGSNNVKRTLVAIDASDFSNTNDSKLEGLWLQSEDHTSRQYLKQVIDRDLNKAYTGFLCQELDQSLHIATGNWGGGSFKGDPLLKAMIQHVAASEAERELHYYPYHDISLKEMLEGSALATRSKGTVGEAYHELLNYAKEKNPYPSAF
ncbi:Hypothetical predicted protein [Cloeon dipterum]|uniref:poly(ADP-ribose) glycohydrolase n=1 Tax=Cloeon dipterum TaxID=197152 RepID=A0A8S1DDE4_9INSE|nr:Hypothetical predicted protein [Cloeon dipterum]